MNHELFELAVDAAKCLPVSGIGTLSEKKVHAALKYYVQPDPEMHEIKTDGFVCDAVSEKTVFEIQTQNFSKLKPKLSALLPERVVTVVYPVIAEKNIFSTDILTGEFTEKKSPKKCTVCDVFYELCSVREFLGDPNFRLRLIVVGAEEYRKVKVRRTKNGKRKSETVSSERIPVKLIDDISVNSVSEYYKILPSGLGELFTAKEFGKAASLYGMDVSRALFTLTFIGVIERCGKSGNAFLYKIKIPGHYPEKKEEK